MQEKYKGKNARSNTALNRKGKSTTTLRQKMREKNNALGKHKLSGSL